MAALSNLISTGRITDQGADADAYPCYAGAGYDSRDCQQIQKYYNRPGFLIGKAGSMQAFNWEDLGNQRCTLEGANEWNMQCQFGRTPAFAVDVHVPDDIQKALAFASQHNLRVVIKSTGHDYFGRSTAPGALLIWLHNFQGQLETKMTFTPSGCDASSQTVDPVITVTGGKTWDDVYPKVDQDFNGKYCIVAGYCIDIGAAGGYTLGGGHSILSTVFGLAVDNVLEMTVVTADGQLLTANSCQNKDLFWALRGGGGGTFGVVTSITFDAAGWGGYHFYNPAFGFSFMFLKLADAGSTRASPPFDQLLKEFTDMEVASRVLARPFANVGTYYKHYDRLECADVFLRQDWRSWSDTTGIYDGFYAGSRVALGSRLIPVTSLVQSRTTAQTILAGASKLGQLATFGFLHINGNGVRNNPHAADTSVTPAWRKSGWHAILVTGWDGSTSEEDIAFVKGLLESGTQVWRDAYPDSGAYFNEASTTEPNWQQAFWGSNYPRLQQIKKTVDPNGMFVCSQCVGSESWDATGNCRI
ncbi:uncharacterized protein LOC129596946 [Paramacrobiotus metropolitanus]|uniref:uncharacterized protein LOC129596946 n=1 Tax=Paramacrobiotus metropolitanus TaxID=2943436 RepID=UPI002445BFC4|nr:uncharacterized protein LOC129596946 [Paramacrobiotus metropolitanus]